MKLFQSGVTNHSAKSIDQEAVSLASLNLSRYTGINSWKSNFGAFENHTDNCITYQQVVAFEKCSHDFINNVLDVYSQLQSNVLRWKNKLQKGGVALI